MIWAQMYLGELGEVAQTGPCAPGSGAKSREPCSSPRNCAREPTSRGSPSTTPTRASAKPSRASGAGRVAAFIVSTTARCWHAHANGPLSRKRRRSIAVAGRRDVVAATVRSHSRSADSDRIALSASALCTGHGGNRNWWRPVPLHCSTQCAANRRERMPWSTPIARLIEAGVACQEAEFARACTYLPTKPPTVLRGPTWRFTWRSRDDGLAHCRTTSAGRISAPRRRVDGGSADQEFRRHDSHAGARLSRRSGGSIQKPWPS